jgi:hypothetical protein
MNENQLADSLSPLDTTKCLEFPEGFDDTVQLQVSTFNLLFFFQLYNGRLPHGLGIF